MIRGRRQRLLESMGMNKAQRRRWKQVLTVPGIILAAYAIRWINLDGIGFLRAGIYIALFFAWGVSVRSRMIQSQSRQAILAIVALMIFWMVVRTTKYEFSLPDTVERFLWYSYYIPMLFMPPLALYAAFFLGKTENYRLPRRAYAPFIVSGIFFLLVATNDLHQQIFSFPKGLSFFENEEYGHEPGYYILMVWIVLCVVSTIFLIFYKSRIPRTKRRFLLPILPVTLMIAYMPFYLWNNFLFNRLAGDLAVVFSLLVIATFECCFRCHLILVNTGYDRLFHISSIRAVITDENYQEYIRSSTYTDIDQEIMRQAENAPVLIDSSQRLFNESVGQGHILWQEDVTKLTDTLAELENVNQYLQGEAMTVQKDFEYEQGKRRLVEKNRLYNRVLTQTKPELEYYLELTEKLEEEADEKEIARLVSRIAFVSSYIKRQNNLIFLDEEDGQISPRELEYCIRESLQNLKLGGVACDYGMNVEKRMSFGEMTYFYKTFYTVTKQILDTLRSLDILFTEENGEVEAYMDIVCDVVSARDIQFESEAACGKMLSVTERGRGYRITFSFSERGDAS